MRLIASLSTFDEDCMVAFISHGYGPANCSVISGSGRTRDAASNQFVSSSADKTALGRNIQKIGNLPQCVNFRMALTGDHTLRMRLMKIMSNYWTVFVVVSALIICLVLEVSIVNVS